MTGIFALFTGEDGRPESDHDSSEELAMHVDSPHTTLHRSRAGGGHILAIALPALLAAAAVSLWPRCPSAAQTTDARRPSRLESPEDASIKPGDDFFAYANGGWLKSTALPAGKERWGARDELEVETRRRI